MKKILLFLVSLFLFIPVAFANTINRIEMDIYLNEDGSANIKEKWEVKGTDGTEWYKVYNDLDTYRLTNFTVSMDGVPLKYKNWDVDESLSEKKGYYGINSTSTGIELCFGKYDLYKNHTFTLNYKIKDFIVNVSDAQILYWNLIDKLSNVDFKNFYVKIHGFYSFPDTLDVWGYGYKGYAYVKGGIIELSNVDEKTMNDQYVVALVKFPLNTFNTNKTTSRFSSFDSVLNAAEEGTFEYDYTIKTSIFTKIWNIIKGLILPVVIALSIFLATKSQGYGYKNNKTIKYNDVMPFRDIPCNKDIYYADLLIKLNNFGYKETNILGAIILKWIKEDKISIRTDKTGIFKKETSSLDLTKNPAFDRTFEAKLFDLMKKASKDGILEPKELENYCRSHYNSFFSIFKNHITEEESKLKSQNLIRPRIDKSECSKKMVMEDKLYEDSTYLLGLKKFFNEFTAMKEKSALEVKVWDEYLMFAYLFGVADKVAAQLKNLYPEVWENMDYDFNTVVYLNHLSSTGYNAASSARSAAESYSSGGGGFSSGGGGGGSFGGGGGGSR